MSATISTADLARRLGDPDLTVVDLRPTAAYNGWRLKGEPRGGHIRGAVAFPGEWLRSVDPAEIAKLLADKHVTPGPHDRPVRRRAGRRRAPWSSASRPTATPTSSSTRTGSPPGPPTRPCRSRPSRTTTSSSRPTGSPTCWPAGHPEAAPAGDYLLFHVNFGVPEEYAEDHIPGALYLDTNWLEDPADWNRRSPEALETALRALGITNKTTVILYGRDTEGQANEKWPGRRAGQIAATRALMILRYAGVDDARLLDGGYDWWVRGGRPLETTPNEPSPVAAFGVADPAPTRDDRRHRGGQGDPGRPGRRGAREHPDVARAHRQRQRLQLHRPGRPDRRRRLGQLRHRRVPHAALPQRGQHDAGVPGDHRELGGSRDHARQVGRVLLRHRLARQRDLVLRLPAGLAARSPSTTVAGSSGARTRSTTRSRSATRRVETDGVAV